MPEQEPVLVPFLEDEVDEVADILANLQHMAGRVTNPVVKACLEEVQEEIAHLTNLDHPEPLHPARRQAA